MKRTFRTLVLSLLGLVLVAVGATAGAPASADSPGTTTIRPPTQPTTGPGGSDVPWSGVTSTKVSFGNAALDYWTFVPKDWQGNGPAPTKAPLVIFLHGWLGYRPVFYQDWINHLVREGNVVIFPCYQSDMSTPPETFTANALVSIHDGLKRLEHASIKPEVGNGMILVSHSWGGPVAANIANRWSSEGLPKPKALLFAEPFNRTLDASLSGIPSATKIDCVVGDDDTTVGRTGCDAIWSKIKQAPAANHDFIWMYSDDHGSPGLVANHRAPTSNTSSSRLDALDWYGYWKLADALRNCTINGTECGKATGRTSQEAYLGRWSDGIPVHPLSITTTKPACPTGSSAKGC